MLTTSQRERIRCHLQNGWKLPDSLVKELWEAYEALERAQGGLPAQPPRAAERGANGSRGQASGSPDGCEPRI